jgi:peptidoglycan/xylan/chitin deacetylase (PgdA/CDA1 family)
MASWRKKVIDTGINLAIKAGIFNISRSLSPQTLTVLNYHRINNADSPDFDLFKPNVSATPEEFARQMDYVQAHYNVISCEQLACWLQGASALPLHPAIITFDDGYYDNLLNAAPVLQARHLSAIIFLTTGFIGTKQPFYWDIVAYCFHHTRRDHADLPLLGKRCWSDPASREKVMLTWVQSLKKIPETQKCNMIEKVGEILDVSIPDEKFSNLYLTWGQVREMSQNGTEFGSHTVNHPILTRIPAEQVRRELIESKRRVEEEIQKPITSLAYPNGQKVDFSSEVIAITRETGFQLAFSLLPGPTRLGTVKSSPLAIRRVYIGRNHTFSRFVAVLAGFSRLFKSF